MATTRLMPLHIGKGRDISTANGINQFTFWGELVFSLPKSANNPFSKGLAF